MFLEEADFPDALRIEKEESCGSKGCGKIARICNNTFKTTSIEKKHILCPRHTDFPVAVTTVK